jgi:hypothetical protein
MILIHKIIDEIAHRKFLLACQAAELYEALITCDDFEVAKLCGSVGTFQQIYHMMCNDKNRED